MNVLEIIKELDSISNMVLVSAPKKITIRDLKAFDEARKYLNGLSKGWRDLSDCQPSESDFDEDGFIWAYDWLNESVVAVHSSSLNNVRHGDEPIFMAWHKKERKPKFSDAMLRAREETSGD